MLFELNFNYEASIKSDCFMFYRTGIISAHSHLKHWLVQHCNNIFMNQNYCLAYGECGRYYDPFRYYEPVLSLKNGDLESVSSEKLFTEYIKKCLYNGTYILVECNFRDGPYGLFDHQVNECLIYGIDEDNGQVIIPAISNGIWKRNKISIRDFIKAHINSHEYRENSLHPKKFVQYPITEIQPKNTTIEPLNLNTYALDILYRYKHMDKIVKCNNDDYFWEGYNACLNGVISLFTQLLKYDVTVLKTYHASVALKKIWEYRLRLQQQDKIMFERFNSLLYSDNESVISRCVSLLQNSYLLVLKYQINKNKSCIESIIDIYNEISFKENERLRVLYEHIMNV